MPSTYNKYATIRDDEHWFEVFIWNDGRWAMPDEPDIIKEYGPGGIRYFLTTEEADALYAAEA